MMSMSQFIQPPRTYTVFDRDKKTSSDDELHFFVVGCGGDGKGMQKSVAELMNAIASNKRPALIVILGDNFYDNGIDAATDPAFNSHFYDIYHAKTLAALAGIPCFIIPGNHDHNIHRGPYGCRNGKINPDKIAAQIKHTFIDKNGVIITERIRLYQEEKLNLSQLPQWNMPSCYYALSLHHQLVEFFMLDSSTYVRAYLASLKSDKHNPNNQAIWLERATKLNKSSIKFLFLHHPLYTIGKRVHQPDELLYLDESDIAELKTLGLVGNYNQLLNQILRRQGIFFDAAFAAHDHSMYYYLDLSKEDGLCQVIAGGGGGKLDARSAVPYCDKVPCFFKNHGFVGVSVHPTAKVDKIIFDFYSVDKHHLQFNHVSTIPRVAKPDIDPQNELRQLLIHACQDYLKKQLINPENFTSILKNIFGNYSFSIHGSSGIYRADNLMNFLHHYEGNTLKQITQHLTESMGYLFKPKDDSLITLIATRIQKKYSISYEEFISRPELILLPRTPQLSLDHPPEFKERVPDRRYSDSFTLFSPRLKSFELAEIDDSDYAFIDDISITSGIKK